MKNKRICITFAGAVGSGKTPIAHYLSIKLLLPIFNNDAIRSEIIEDLDIFNEKEHIKRRNLRLEEAIKNCNSFICDISIDREWENFRDKLISNNYTFFIISIDLSKKLLAKLYKTKKYLESLEKIDKIIEYHEDFLNKYSDDINLCITDENFLNRIELSYNEVKKHF